jgi:hypothetical protein
MDHSCHYLCSELVTVIYEEQPGELHQTIANLEEISMTSATILLDEKPRVGAPICMTLKGHDLFGVVLSRSFDNTVGWLVTVSLDPDSTWSPECFSPQHLLGVCLQCAEAALPREVETLEIFKVAEENRLASFLTWGS